MMDISIIIVNYNVRFFLEQCIRSVYGAKDGLAIEIIVVDNHSVDGSVQMIKEKFSDVILIENKENVGFSKANNQGIHLSKGKYVLLLNPDTVLQEDTLIKCFQFMETHADAGALGVKMFDGKGNFLPESKRGLPTPIVAFYKIFGLSKLFPKSKIFGKYHLTYLDKNTNHVVDVLSGAFMFIRKEVLDKIGGLDEDFFMYGEDIDLSYRIKKAGYHNYYLSETSIIHYKGESTKKSSINYVLTFYKAMQIFADKHFSNSYAHVFHFMIYIAIYFRAGLSIIHRFFKRLLIPLSDIAFMSFFILLFAFWYEKNYKLSENYYDRNLLYISVIAYSCLMVLNVYFQGGYEKHPKYKNILQGNIIGLLMVLSIYALLPENLRFSRGIILAGSIIAWLYFTLSRWLYFFIGVKNYSYLSSVLPKNILIVGDEEEFERVKKIIQNSPVSINYIGLIKTSETQTSTNPYFSGYLKDIEEIIRLEKIDEVIFCTKQLNMQNIIEWMIKLSYLPVHYKIAHPDELYIIGSNDIHSQGELYSLDFKTILLPENQRKKRVLDILLSLITLVLLPFIIFLFKQKKQLIKNIFEVLLGHKTWVGLGKFKDEYLPKLKPSVLFIGKLKGYDERADKAKELSYLYCKHYQPYNDLLAFFRLFHLIDHE
ncbi:MAG: glycosyltransferase family 2 protein [Bacteroidia bacterium]|nr:glycosyltransferase family 2 protein [Bacteroidia bacterium]